MGEREGEGGGEEVISKMADCFEQRSCILV